MPKVIEGLTPNEALVLEIVFERFGALQEHGIILTDRAAFIKFSEVPEVAKGLSSEDFEKALKMLEYRHLVTLAYEGATLPLVRITYGGIGTYRRGSI